MAKPPARGINVRKTGLAVAVGLLLIGLGVLGLLAVRGSGQGAAAPATRSTIQPVAEVAPPPIDVAAEGLRNAGRAKFQFADRRDPTRLAGQLEWAALEPLTEGRSLVAEPRAMIYLDDGLVAFVRARRGRVFIPPGGQQPESGSFEGGVPMALFAPKADGSIDVERDRPVGLLFTPVMNFNLALGEVTLPERFRLSTQTMEMAGRGLRLVGDQVARRIELLEIEQTDSVRLAPPAEAERAAENTGGEAGAEPKPGEPGAGESAGRRDLYRLVIDSRVRALWRGLSVRADRFEAWAELIDGVLPAGAIGGMGSGRGGAEPPRVANAESGDRPAAGALAVDPQTGEPASLAEVGEEPIRLTWEGPLRLQPAGRMPEELERERVAVRLSAARTGVVVYADTDSGQSVQAASIDYGATTRTLTLTGTGPRSVVLTAQGRGRLEVEQLSVNLGTGVGAAIGPGVLVAAGDERPRRGPANDRGRQISWNDQADIVLSTGGGWISGGIKEAMFAGKVLAESGRASVSAGFVRVLFAEAEAGITRLARIEARDNVLVDPGPTESLRAQRLDVAFEPARWGQGGNAGRGDEPSVITATGRVSAQRGEWRVDGGLLEARLTTDARGERQVSSVRVEQSARIRGPQGTEAVADRIDADVPGNGAVLTGRSVTLSRDGAMIQGTEMALDGNQRRLLVKGAGTFRFFRERGKDQLGGGTVLAPMGRARSGGASAQRVDASWTRALRIDDLAGTVEAEGSARATSNPSPAELDTLTAERLVLSFTPAGEAEQVGAFATSGVPDRRRLVRAEAIGAGPESPARIESRRFAEVAGDAEARTLERLIFAEGERLTASETEGRIEIPGPGRLLVDDRRAADPRGGLAQGPVDFEAGRGTSLFTWQGGLTFDRVTGQAELLRQVRLLHRVSPERSVTTLDAERLTAVLRAPGVFGAPEAEAGEQAELVSASAEGAVVLQNEGRELSADLLRLDAIGSVAEASAAADNRVTLFDPARPQPLSARRMVWDLRANRVTVQEPTPIVVPR
jgi:lipopolysaccharide export system protein LptA